MFRYLLSLLLSLFLLQIVAQDDIECIKRFNALENTSISAKDQLILHYDALDSLLSRCQHENKEWINQTIDKAISFNDSLINHSFTWSYYLYLYRAERYEEANEYALKLIKYSEENDFNLSGDFYIEVGLNYYRLGDFPKEINAYEKAITAYKRDKSSNLVYAQSCMGNFYQNLEDYDKALPYHIEAYESALNLKPDYIKYYNTTNKLLSIANNHFYQGSNDQAKEFFEKAIEDSRKQKNQDLSLTVFSEYISFLIKTDQLIEAQKLIHKADHFVEEPQVSKVLKSEYVNYYRLVKSKYSLESNELQNLVHPDSLLKSNQPLANQKEIYQYAIDYYQSKKQTEKALEVSIKHTELIEDEAKRQNASAIDLLMEQRKTSQLKYENNQLKESEEKTRITIIILIGFLLLAGSLLYKIQESNNNIKSLNKLIAHKNEKITDQLNEMEEISYIMTHDLKEPANTVNSFANLVLQSDENNISKKNISYVNIIKKSSENMLRNVESLHNYLLLGQAIKLQFVSVQSLFENAQINLSGLIKKTEAIITSDALPSIFCYPQDLQIVFQNLLSNSIKYSKPNQKPRIHLTIENLQNYHQFTLSDQGIGISEDDQKTIFQLFKRLHSKSEIEGSGIGLANVRKIIDLHKGNITVESKIGEGSNFIFTIDKKLE